MLIVILALAFATAASAGFQDYLDEYLMGLAKQKVGVHVTKCTGGPDSPKGYSATLLIESENGNALLVERNDDSVVNLASATVNSSSSVTLGETNGGLHSMRRVLVVLEALARAKYKIIKPFNLTKLNSIEPALTCPGDKDMDFGTPEATIRTLYAADTNEAAGKCFYSGNYMGADDSKRWWLNYNISDFRNTTHAGELNYQGISISPDAVEITVRVKMDDPSKGNPTTEFWYLLQKFDGKWKIIENSHIPDENYPPID